MRAALELLDAREPDFAYEGEMNIDAALDQSLRDRLFEAQAASKCSSINCTLDTPRNSLIPRR